jgi:hypothetical protein
MGRGEAYTGFWWGNLKVRDNLGEPGVDGRIILRWVFRKWDVGQISYTPRRKSAISSRCGYFKFHSLAERII